MKTMINESKAPIFKKLGFLGIGLCMVCCTLPVIGAVVGIGALTSLAVYLEKIGMAILIASAGFFAFWYITKSKRASKCATTCDTNSHGTCNCSNEKSPL